MTSAIQPAQSLAEQIEAGCGSGGVYRPGFLLVTADGRRLSGREAAAELATRGARPVLRSARSGLALAYEWIGEGERWDESWPAPGATMCVLDDEGRVAERRDFGGFLR